jgi:hypothetical protein
MQEWISLFACTERLYKSCYWRLFWGADRASSPLSPHNLTYFAFLWFNISMLTILLLMICSSMAIEHDICDMIGCLKSLGPAIKSKSAILCIPVDPDPVQQQRPDEHGPVTVGIHPVARQANHSCWTRLNRPNRPNRLNRLNHATRGRRRHFRLPTTWRHTTCGPCRRGIPVSGHERRPGSPGVSGSAPMNAFSFTKSSSHRG